MMSTGFSGTPNQKDIRYSPMEDRASDVKGYEPLTTRMTAAS